MLKKPTFPILGCFISCVLLATAGRCQEAAPASNNTKASAVLDPMLERSRQATRAGNLNEALRLLEELLVKERARDDKNSQVETLLGISKILEMQGKYSEAVARFEQRLKVLQSFAGDNNALRQAKTLYQTGVLWHLAGDDARAKQAYQAAQKVRGVELAPEVALCDIGDLYQEAGRQRFAVAAYEDALQFSRAPGNDHSGEARLLARIANARGPLRVRLRPELAVQTGHNALVLTVAVSPDGATIASGDAEGALKVWNARTGELLRTIDAHHSAITKIAWSQADNSVLASASSDSTLKLWNARAGAPLRTILHQGPLASVAISPNGKIVASAETRGLVRLWDAQSGAELAAPDAIDGGISEVAFSPDGTTLAISGTQLKDGKESGLVLLGEVATGKVLRTFTDLSTFVSSIAWSPDGKTLAGQGGDGETRLWEFSSGKLLRTLPGRVGLMSRVAWSPDGKTLAVTATGDISSGVMQSDEIKLWDVATGTPRRALVMRIHFPITVAFSPDGRTLVSGGLDKSVKLWDVGGGKIRQMFPPYTQLANEIGFLPDGTLAAGEFRFGLGGARAEYKQWDIQTGEFKRVLMRYAAPSVQRLNGDFNAANGILAIIRAGVNLELTDMRTNRLLWKTTARVQWSHAEIAPDARTVAVSSDDKTIRLWDVMSGRLLHTLTGAKDSLENLIFSRDGAMLAGGALNPGDTDVKVWDLATGVLMHSLGGNQKGVYTFAFSPDNRTLASAGADGTVRIWELAGGKLLHTLEHKAPMFGNEQTTAVADIAFTSDGATLASAAADGTIRLWNAQTGTLRRVLEGRSGIALTIAFSPDNRRLASGSYDGAIRLWDVASGKAIATLLSLPPAGVVSGLTGNDVIDSGKPGLAKPDESKLQSEGLETDLSEIDDYLVSTEEGYYTGSAAADRYVRFRLGDDLFPAESFQSRYYRPDLVRAVLAGRAVPAVGEFKGAFPPLAGFAAMPGGNKLSGATATITLQATDDSAVKRVELFVNGTRVDAKAIEIGSKALEVGSKSLDVGDRPIPTAHKSLKNFSATIPLPSQGTSIKVQAIAYDDDGLQSPRTEMLFTRDPQARASGRLLGLCVGVSQYQDARLNLKYADNDATSLSQTLNRQRGLYSDAKTSTLTNKEATRDNVKKALDGLIAQTTRADTVWVMLSGHGWRSDERSFYFATHEVDRQNVAATALPWTDVVSRLQKLSEKSKRVIVLLDACHSGSAATNEELVKATLSANAGVLIFASSKGSEVSLELGELQHGAFTQALTEGIEGKAAVGDDKAVTTIDFIAYVSRRVKTLTGDAQHPQVPFLQDFDTDAPIVARLAQ